MLSRKRANGFLLLRDYPRKKGFILSQEESLMMWRHLFLDAHQLQKTIGNDALPLGCHYPNHIMQKVRKHENNSIA